MKTPSKTTLNAPITQGFAFNEATHTYTFNGVKMTGVTSMLGKVLAKPALIPWAAKMATEYIKEHATQHYVGGDFTHYEVTEEQLEEAKKAHASVRDNAGDTGKEVHKAIEDYVKLMIRDQAGKPYEITGNENKHLEAFIQWARNNEVTFLDSEAVFWNQDLFLAGTADLVFEKEGVKCFGDIKIKNKIWSREPFLQMAAYHLLSESMGNTRADKSVILRIDPKTAELEELWSLNVPADRDAFMNVYYLYKYMS